MSSIGLTPFTRFFDDVSCTGAGNADRFVIGPFPVGFQLVGVDVRVRSPGGFSSSADVEVSIVAVPPGVDFSGVNNPSDAEEMGGEFLCGTTFRFGETREFTDFLRCEVELRDRRSILVVVRHMSAFAGGVVSAGVVSAQRMNRDDV